MRCLDLPRTDENVERLEQRVLRGHSVEPDEDEPRVHDASDQHRDQRRNEEVDAVLVPRIRMTPAMARSEHVTIVGLVASKRRLIALPPGPPVEDPCPPTTTRASTRYSAPSTLLR